ncbi:MAG: hypothetical protein E7I46_03900 [Finegoldia magna]|nr:hypothetical protein [Finegoldia magna]
MADTTTYYHQSKLKLQKLQLNHQHQKKDKNLKKENLKKKTNQLKKIKKTLILQRKKTRLNYQKLVAKLKS